MSTVIKNIGFIVVFNILIKPFAVIFENEVQNHVGHSIFGMYTALYSLVFISISFFECGMNIYITKELSSKSVRSDQENANIYYYKLILVILFPVTMFFLGFFLGYNKAELYYLVILSACQAILHLILFFKANFQSKQFFIIDAIIANLDKGMLILFISISLGLNILNIDIYVYLRFVSILITLLISWIVFERVIGKVKVYFNINVIKRVIQNSWPFAFFSMLYIFNDKIDQVMLERLLDKSQAGLYAASYRWIDISMMYIWMVMPVFFTQFAKYAENQSALKKILSKGQIFISIPVVFVSLCIFFYGDKLFWRYTNSSIDELNLMTSVTKILFISYTITGFFVLYMSLINATGYIKKMSYHIAISLLINISLNFYFIPKYQIIGAAITTIISSIYLLCATFFILLLKTSFFKLLPWKLILECVILFLFGGVILASLNFFNVNFLLSILLLGSLFASYLLKYHYSTIFSND